MRLVSKTSKDMLGLGGGQEEGEPFSQTPLLELGHRRQAGEVQRNGRRPQGEGPAGITLEMFRVK